MHLAQINIAYAKYPIEDRRMADFVGALNRINALAERSPGFLWRLKDDEADNATQIAVPGHPEAIINMSVWQSVGALENFVWKTAHKRVYSRKAEWFEAPGKPTSPCGGSSQANGRRPKKDWPAWRTWTPTATRITRSTGPICHT